MTLEQRVTLERLVRVELRVLQEQRERPVLLAQQGLLVTLERLGLQVLPVARDHRVIKVSKVLQVPLDQPDQPVRLELPVLRVTLGQPGRLERKAMAISLVLGIAERRM